MEQKCLESLNYSQWTCLDHCIVEHKSHSKTIWYLLSGSGFGLYITVVCSFVWFCMGMLMAIIFFFPIQLAGCECLINTDIDWSLNWSVILNHITCIYTEAKCNCWWMKISIRVTMTQTFIQNMINRLMHYTLQIHNSKLYKTKQDMHTSTATEASKIR